MEPSMVRAYTPLYYVASELRFGFLADHMGGFILPRPQAAGGPFLHCHSGNLSDHQNDRS